jgi:phosphocarrier protein
LSRALPSGNSPVCGNRRSRLAGYNQKIAAMSESAPTLSCTVQITNAAGLHLRAANLFVEQAAKYQSKVEIIKDFQRVDGKSMMNLLMLGAACGSEIQIEVTGGDAEPCLAALKQLVVDKFYENDKTPTT